MRGRTGIFGKMRLWGAFVCLLLGLPVAAQDFSGLARIDAGQSAVRDEGAGAQVVLYLSQPVPWRVFTLDAPRRLVMDFREVDWRGADADAMRTGEAATAVRFGALRPGWSRLVVDLSGPFAVATAEMRVDTLDGTAVVEVRLAPVDAEAFAQGSGEPPGPGWDMMEDVVAKVPPPAADDTLVVAIDAGHGGIDPGAVRAGMVEAEEMLRLARELAEAVDRTDGMRAVLTRDDGAFVPLEARITIARAAGADVLLSLHADALELDEASGASIYTLSDAAASDASVRMAERHEQGDLLAGVDLTGADDTVATVLMDIARLETRPAGLRLADEIVAGLRDAGARLNSRPRREGPLAVLGAADFPAVLIEIGFLSSARDRDDLSDPAGRARIVAGIVQALARWDAGERARAPLLRQ